MKTHASLAAGVLAAMGATACCFGPMPLVTLGFSGARAAGPRSLAPLQPVFAELLAKAVTEAGYPASFRK